MYLPHANSQSGVSGKRSSIQVINLLIERSDGSRGLRIFADHDLRIGRVPVWRNDEIRRRGHALEHATGEVEFRLVARAEETDQPFVAQDGTSASSRGACRCPRQSTSPA